MALDGIDPNTRTQEILLAASNHDLDTLKPLLRVPGAASVQDIETGFTPLHAAIAACGPFHKYGRKAEVKNVPVNGKSNGNVGDEEEDEDIDIEKAKATVKELFLSGAIWNDLDSNDDTPGCLAWRLGQKELYELVVEAGLRAELLMNLMGGYEQLPDNDSEEEEADEAVGEDAQPADDMPGFESNSEEVTSQQKDVNSEDYLKSDLTFTSDKLLDADANGVMMAWETPIMALTSSLLVLSPSPRILNIGFGLGIIDRLFAAASPSAHHIIEAHPAVLAKLRDPVPNSIFKDFGPEWLKKGDARNVIHEGRWQDVVPKLLEEGQVFDVIYFDTFGEDYSQLKTFFMDYVIGLLSPDGRFGFFNGLGADRRVCYDVYCRVVELDLCDAGLDVEWFDVEIDLEGNSRDREGTGLAKESEGEWKGVRRRYWTLEKYRLPICSFMG